MCLIVLAWQVHPRWPLLLLAHRDEFRNRPAAPMDWWTQPPLLGGRDLRAGGTWLGVNRQGRFAALTNVRQGPASTAALSRGVWVPRALDPQLALDELLLAQSPLSGAFNLLHGDRHTLRIWHSPLQSHQLVEPGVHALSNAALDTPWPKVTASRTHLRAMLQGMTADAELDEAALWSVGAHAEVAAGELPDTGVGPQWERRLAPALILGPDYGTVSRTLLAMQVDGQVLMVEQQLDEHGQVHAQRRDRFQIEP